MIVFVVGAPFLYGMGEKPVYDDDYKTEEQQDEAIIIIRNGLVKHSQIADPEINLSATLIELESIKK